MASPTQWTWVWANSQRWSFGEWQGGLVCCSPWGYKELDMTERLNNKFINLKGAFKYLILFYLQNNPEKTWKYISISSLQMVRTTSWGDKLNRSEPTRGKTMLLSPLTSHFRNFSVVANFDPFRTDLSGRVEFHFNKVWQVRFAILSMFKDI